jgi:fucose permease
MCIAIATNFPPVFLTTFGETFGGAAGLTKEQLGRIPAFVFGGFVVGIGITSPLADRLGAKGFILIGLLSLAAGLALLGRASSYSGLLGAALLLGLGAGTLEVVLSPVVAALHPHRRASALNWLHSSYCFGAVCTVLLGSLALHIDLSWRAVSFGLVAVPIAFLVGFLFQRALILVHEDAEQAAQWPLLRHPYFIAALALIFLGGATEIGMAQWLPAYAERGLGFSKASGGIALAVFSIAMMVGRICIGFLVVRVGLLSLMLVSCGASAILILLACFLPQPLAALVACVALGFTVCCFWPTTLGIASDRFPHGGAFMFGSLCAFGNAGCIVMPWLVGVIADRSQLSWGLAAIIVCPMIMVLILAAMSRAQSPGHV